MLNYEGLYEDLQPVLKDLKDSASAAGRLQKAINKDIEAGNLVNARKNIDSMKQTAQSLTEAIKAVSDITGGFDTQTYFADGDFTRQLLEVCKEIGIDVVGERGNYEMFPFKVRIVGDEEHEGEVYVNRK